MTIKTEHAYPKLILHWMGLDQISPHDFDAYYRKLDENLQGDLSFNSLGPGRSWNIPQMKMAARLLRPDVSGSPQGNGLYRWWELYFKMQLVLDVPEGPTPDLLGYFDGNEPFSPTYTPWRWGAVAGVRFAAKRDGRQDIVELCDSWFGAASFMADAMSAEGPDMERQKNRKGQLFDNARAVSPVGERGASGHEITDTRLFLGKLLQADFFTRREDWTIKVFREAVTPQNTIRCNTFDVAKLRWWSEQHVILYPSGRLVYKPERKNWNTPCYMWDFYDYAKQTSVLGFPWPDGRQFGAKGSGNCGIEERTLGKMIVATTDYDTVSHLLPDEPILSHVVFGPEGFKRLV